MSRIRVVLADDHTLLRAGLRMLVNAEPDLLVVGEAGAAPEALRLAQELRPDVLTLDLTIPGGDAAQLIEQLRRDCPRTRVLVLTTHDDPVYLRGALAAGAVGYLVKTATETEFLSAVRAVHEGRLFVDLSLREGTLPEVLGKPAGPHFLTRGASAVKPLSRREREVLHMLAQGYGNQHIAEKLVLSVKTVETYRARITEKLGLRTRAEIVRYAVATGLLSGSTFPSSDRQP